MIFNIKNLQLAFSIVILLMSGGGYGQDMDSSELKLFSKVDNEDLFWQTPIEEKCKTLPGHVRDKVQSIKTDVCIIIFTTMDCQDRENGKIQLAAGEYANINDMLPPPPGGLPFRQKFESFHACETARARGTAMTTIRRVELGDSFDNQAIVSYRDVEKCTNLPEFSFGELNTVNAHGSCVQLYSELDCTGETLVIPEKRRHEWVDLFEMHFSGKSKSLMPCPEDNSASNLKGTIQKITVSHVNPGPVPVHMEVTSNQFINRGDTPIKQYFICSKSIQQVLAMKGPRGLRKMGEISRGKNLRFETDEDEDDDDDHDHNTSGSGEFLEGVLNTAAQLIGTAWGTILPPDLFPNVSSLADSIYRHEETKVFTSNNLLDLKPCTTQTIDSFVEVLKQCKLKYIMELLVTSRDGSLTAPEIANIAESIGLPVINPKVDEQTVMCLVEGTAVVDMPMNAVVNTMTTKLARCDGLVGSVRNQTMGVTIAPETTSESPLPVENEVESQKQPDCPPANAPMEDDLGAMHDKSSQCGGEFTTPTGEIHFKVDAPLNSKRCVWVIRPNATEKVTSFKVDIGKGFVPIKGQREIILSGHSRLQDAVDVIPTGSGSYKVQGNILVIMFYTELPKRKEVPPVGGGIPDIASGIIRLRYKTGHDYQIYTISPDSKDYRINLGGTQVFTYPMEMLPPVDYPNRDLSTFVMLPPNLEDIRTPYIVNINAFVEDECCDYLMLYQFENGRWKRETSSKEKERLVKGSKHFEIKDVMLGVFHSDVIVPAGGFSMQFKLKKANYKLALNLTSEEAESGETGEYLL